MIKVTIMKLFTRIKAAIITRIEKEVESFSNEVHSIIEQVKIDVDNSIKEALSDIPFSGVKSN